MDFSFDKMSLFAVLSVAVSLFIADIYPWLTRRFIPGTRRDYLRGEGFRDFYYVYVYAFVFAIALWLAVVLAGLVRTIFRWMFLYGERDRPVDLVRKMRNRSVFARPMKFHPITVDGNTRLVLKELDDGKALVSSKVLVTLTGPDKAAHTAVLTTAINALSGWTIGWHLARWRVLKEAALNFEGGLAMAIAARGERTDSPVPLIDIYDGT